MVYDDLPDELRNLLSTVLIPDVIRHVISGGWERMTPGERRQCASAVRRQRDPRIRTLDAVRMAAATLLTKGDIETIEL